MLLCKHEERRFFVERNSVIVLHAMWDHSAPAHLHVWAETSQPLRVTGKRSGRKAGAGQPNGHPFALPHDLLRDTLGALAGRVLVESAQAETLVLSLPSGTPGPLPSPELICEEPRAMNVRTCERWSVPTFALKPDEALAWLLALPDNPPSVAVGSALRFWLLATRLAYELLARQAYMPTLQAVPTKGKREAKIGAAWRTVLAPDDGGRVTALAGMMPAVCWSFLSPGAKPATLPREILQHFLDTTIDAFVRRELSTTHFIAAPQARQRKAIPLPEQWLRGLASTEQATLVASASEMQQFTTALVAWLRQLRLDEKQAAFRTCFRLDPPAAEEGEADAAWRVSFHLQANDDRSLLVPAETVWKERSSTLTFLKRTFENPQERLLADLGRASRLFPTIEESLRTARPGDVRLTTPQAYAFLREAAPLLEQSGFGVLVPPWWQKTAARLGVKLKIKPKTGGQISSGLLGLESIVTYDWTVSIGDMTLSAREFEKLVNLKMPLIQVRGQWVELRPEEIERAIAFFQKKRKNGQMTLGEALRTGLGEELSEVGLPVLDITGDGWLQDLLTQLSDNLKLAPIATPAAFQGQLRPYQLKGVAWLAFLTQFGLGGCLADDMGLGKTIELITLLLHDRERRQEQTPPNPALLICPMSIVGNWQREVQRFAPSLNVMVHHGHERLSGEAFVDEARRHAIVITTYALALRDKEHLAALDWEYVVVDEAQNIKNEAAKQTIAIKNIRARHKIALTGTPVENRLAELWSIMEFLNPGYLGSATDFRKQFAMPIERFRDAERANLLKRVVQPFLLRRLKTDKSIIADLPDKMEMKVFCNLTQEQASLYEAVVKEMLAKIEEADGIERRGLVLATLLKLKQVCNHPAQFVADSSSLPGRSGKLARLEEMLEEVLAGGDKALIFSQFAEMGGMLRRHLQETFGCEVLFLHGGTPKKQRDAMVQRFQEEKRGAPLFILSLKAGGVGLNLTAANHVFHFDRWWNPAVENQATDRAFRIGQSKAVQVHKFVCVGTLEERIDMMIEQKKELAESIVGSGEGWLTEMSTTQLKELFALSREAVGE